MTWSYSGNPAANDKDAVRFTVGDTDDSNELLQDEEIVFLIGEGGSVLYASVLAAENLSCKFAVQADCKVGEVSRAAGQIAEHFRMCSRLLRQRFLILGAAKPVFGGISFDEERSLRQDFDLKGSFASLGQFDNPVSALDFKFGRLFPFNQGGEV